MIRRATRAAVPAVLGALLLAGCGTPAPGTAAVVGSERLTVAEVQERTESFVEAYPEAMSSGVTQAQVTAVTVENFIRRAIVEATAADLGIELAQAEIDTFIADRGGLAEVTRLTSSAGVPPDPELVRGEVRSAVLQRAIGEEVAGEGATDDDIIVATTETIAAMTARLDIEVNPRYGSWNGSSVDASDGSLSTPFVQEGTTVN